MACRSQALALTGYISPTPQNPLPVQPAAVVDAIRWFTGPVPTVLLILSILFAWGYPITRERHRAMRDEIARSLLEE